MPLSVAQFKQRFAKVLAPEAAQELVDKLAASGRLQYESSAPDAPLDNELARQARVETRLGEVLGKVEKATADQQAAWNKAITLKMKPHEERLKEVKDLLDLPKVKGKGAQEDEKNRKTLDLEKKQLEARLLELSKQKVRITHAVSAHGKGTDQEGRVLHGHRADEAVTGTPTEVGTDPSNTSGAFTSNVGMLNVVTEAFAQADLVAQHGERQRAAAKASGKAVPPTMDQERFATSMEMGNALGYTLTVDGVSEQTSGRELLPGEIDHRRDHMQRTDDVSNATVVMDPGYLMDDKGELVLDKDGKPKRVGWNMQTAFAHDNAPLAGSSYAKVDELAQGPHQKEFNLRLKTEELDGARKRRAENQKALEARTKGVDDALHLISSAMVTIKEAAAEASKQNETSHQHALLLEGMESKFAAIDPSATDAASRLALLQSFAALTDAEQLTRRKEIAALPGEFGKFLNDCKSQVGREQDLAIFDAALQMALALVAKCAALENKSNAEKRKLAGDKKFEIETKKVEADTTVGTLRASILADEQAAELLVKETFALRGAMHGIQSAHEKEHGLSGTPPASEGYDYTTGLYTGPRPAKPPVLTGVDERFDPLTAHHLYPWNRIKEDLNRALKAQSKSQLQALFDFAEFTPGAGFWDELAKPPAARNYAFVSDINVAAQTICWCPRNIFMGPLGEQRSDDPGEELDKTYENGKLTLNAQIAQAFDAQGGINPQLDKDEVKAHLVQVLYEQKLKDLTKADDKAKPKAPTEEQKKKKLEESINEIGEDDINKAIAERVAAHEALQKLYLERDELNRQRIEAIKSEIKDFEQKHAARMSRRTAAEVLADLQQAALQSLPPETDVATLKIPRSKVDKEIALRESLHNKLARLKDKLQHMPKDYRQDEWAAESGGKKRQKTS